MFVTNHEHLGGYYVQTQYGWIVGHSGAFKFGITKTR